jgi:hypothetical protein
MDWHECKQKKIVKEVSVDEDLVKSLIISSQNKDDSQKQLTLSPVTAASKISLVYDALRELLEAYSLLQGYKIYNHECYCALLKEIIGKHSLGDDFDELRRVRNAVNYYGKEITVEQARDFILKTQALRLKIKELIKT